jgi:hypothetical protein
MRKNRRYRGIQPDGAKRPRRNGLGGIARRAWYAAYRQYRQSARIWGKPQTPRPVGR